LTPEGPKEMHDLQIGDEVLAYDQHTGKNHFSKVGGWLHHNPEG